MPEAEVQTAEPKKPGVDAKYREKYGKERSCGDALAARLKEYLYPQDSKKIDPDRLSKLFSDNDIDEAKYEGRNIGMKRMTIGNILRARAQKGEIKVVVGGKKFVHEAE